MIPELAEIDSVCQRIEDFFDTPSSYWKNLSPKEAIIFRATLRRNQVQNEPLYESAAKKLHEVLPRTPPVNIIQAFEESSRLLKLMIGGYIFTNFDEIYVPLMVDEIKTGTTRISPMFLQSLTDNLGAAISSLILQALNIKTVQNQALHSVRQLNLTDAIPTLNELAQNERGDIASLAQEILLELQGINS